VLPPRMKAFLCLLSGLLLIGLLRVTAYAQFQRFGGNPFEPPAAILHYARNRDYHVEHLQLVFVVHPDTHSAEGTVTHTLAPLRSGLSTIVLDAGANLQIKDCTLDGASVTFEHNGDKLILHAPSPLQRGKYVKVSVHYIMPGGTVGGGANGVGGFKWIDPTPSDPNRAPEFWTQGETDTNRNWVPCYDYPNDKCTSETIVTVPDTWTVIGNGQEGPVTEDRAHHTKTFHWIMNQPHSTYLLSLVGGELDVYRTHWENVPLLYVTPKGQGELAPYSFSDTPDMLSFYSQLLDFKYPWPKYAEDAVYDFPGGMENVSATTLGNIALTDPRAGLARTDSLTAHELAHQWFGDTVTCKDWGNIWLNEGFATFMQMLYTRHRFGEEEWQADKEGALQSYLREAHRYLRPLSTKLYSNPDVLFDSTTYSKGALVLEMLRDQLGQDNLFRGLHHYLEVYKFRPVDSHDLMEAITDETGINVEPFFDQWVYKPGHPVLQMSWRYDPQSATVQITVKQLQDTSHGVPIFHMPITFGLIYPNRASSDRLQRVTENCDQAEQEFSIPETSAPAAVLLDPDHELIKQMETPKWSEAEARAILLCAPDYVDRLEAARQIVAQPGGLTAEREQLFIQALKSEPAWRVASFLLQQLGNLKDPALRSLFLQQTESKQPERVAAALEALAQLPADAATLTLIHRDAISDTAPYPVVEGALNALAKLAPSQNLDVFRHQIEAKTPRDQLAYMSVNALAEAHVDAAGPLLLEAASPAHFYFTRLAAIRALGHLDRGDSTVSKGLANLLSDSNPQIQRSVIEALQERGDKSVAPILQAFETQTSDPQLKQAAEDAIANLKRGD